MTRTEQGRDPRHYLGLIWRHKWLLLAIVVLIPTGVYVISSQVAETYRASTTLFVQTTSVTSPEFSDQVAVSTSSPEDVRTLVETPLVAEIAARELNEPADQSRALLRNIDASLASSDSSDSSNFLTITANAEEPQRAADLAEAFAAAIAAKRTSQAQQAIDSQIKELTDQAPAIKNLGESAQSELADELRQLRTLRASQTGATQVVSPVVVPGAAISPRPLRNALLGLIFALLLAVGLLPLLDRLDRKIREPDEVAEIVGEPLLAMVPAAAFPGQVPKPEVREAFQTLRAGLTYFNIDRKLGSILVTSPGHGEGKTTVSTNLAVALAQDGRDVILVDLDLRRGQVAARLGVDASIGLDAVLIGDRSIDGALIEIPRIDGGRLRVIPHVTAPPSPAVLLGSQRMRDLLEELQQKADIVVLDTAPLLVVSDALPLLKAVDGIVLVARTDYTNRDALAKARNVIAAADGTILGVVATGTKASGLYGYDLQGYDESVSEPSPLPAMEGTGNGRDGARLPRVLRRGESSESPTSDTTS